MKVQNAQTKELYNRINASGNVLLSGTELDGRPAIRFHDERENNGAEHVDARLAIIIRLAEEMVC